MFLGVLSDLPKEHWQCLLTAQKSILDRGNGSPCGQVEEVRSKESAFIFFEVAYAYSLYIFMSRPVAIDTLGETV